MRQWFVKKYPSDTTIDVSYHLSLCVDLAKKKKNIQQLLNKYGEYLAGMSTPELRVIRTWDEYLDWLEEG